MIVIAHRLASISEFDRIFVFKDGKIVGNGAFEELLANNHYFYELYNKEKTGTSCLEEINYEPKKIEMDKRTSGI